MPSPRPVRFPRLAVLLSVAPLAACASSASTRAPIDDPTANVIATTRIEGTAGTAELRTVNNGAATTETPIAAPVAKAFAALPTVYEALGVPANTILSDAATFGARDTRMPRRLGKASLSQFVDCGGNAGGAANADSYAVTMTVLSRVTPASGGTGSVVTTQLLASARPVTVAGNTVQCASTGRLEQAINQRLAVEAAR